MDDFQDIFYVILGVVFLLFRLFKKNPQEQQPSPQPSGESKPEKSLFDTIREEIERQKKLNVPASGQKQPEVKQKVFSSKKTKANPGKFLNPAVKEGTNMSVNIYKGEGGTSTSEMRQHIPEADAHKEEAQLEFDPREAFLLKTLLEHPYS